MFDHKQLKPMREELKLTQKDVAELIGFKTIGSYQRIERGTARPSQSLEVLLRMLIEVSRWIDEDRRWFTMKMLKDIRDQCGHRIDKEDL